MKKIFLALAVSALVAACGDDDTKSTENNTTNPCGAGQKVESSGELACVYTSALIEEGFLCPEIVPFGFLLADGGVACVDNQTMPDPLVEALGELGLEPKETGCFGENPASTCFYNTPTDGPAFDLSAANTLTYTAGGGFGFCVDSLLDFAVDLSTGAATIGYLVPGDPNNDNCLTMPPECEVRAESTLQLDATQLQQVKDLYAAVPAPQCVEDSGRVCDFCLIETLSVDDQEVDTACCGETAADFGPAVEAVADYLRTLIPQQNFAFANATTFNTLTYATGGGLGYCLEPDQVVQATLTRQQDGSLSIEGTMAVVGDEQTDTCIQDTIELCLVATPFGPMTLMQDVQTSLETKLAALPAPMCVIDQGLACDPCLIRSIELDGTLVDDYCCGDTAVGYDAAFNEIAAIIEASN